MPAGIESEFYAVVAFFPVGIDGNVHLVTTFHRYTLGEMPYMQSHQGKNEIFKFLKNSFSKAKATSWGILKRKFRTLGPSDTCAVDAFSKHFWHTKQKLAMLKTRCFGSMILTTKIIFRKKLQ